MLYEPTHQCQGEDNLLSLRLHFAQPFTQTKSCLSRLLDGSLRLSSNSLGVIGHLLFQILHGGGGRAVKATAVVDDTADLDNTDTSEEEVDSSEPSPSVSFPHYHNPGSRYIQVVLGGDDHAPTSPDAASGHQGTVLSEGELLGRAAKIGDTGDDKSPLVESVRQYVSIVWYFIADRLDPRKGFQQGV